MATVETGKEQATHASSARAVETKLEVITIPVSDIERAKVFYEGLGWKLDADFKGDGWRAVQLTPPGSPCSIHLGTDAVPGSAQGLFLVVDDIEAARAELRKKGAEVSEPFHFAGIRGPRLAGPTPSAARTSPTPRSTIPTAMAGCCRRSAPGCLGEASPSMSRR
jgi:predicted enzyme related to lactoylglutathione lyase